MPHLAGVAVEQIEWIRPGVPIWARVKPEEGIVRPTATGHAGFTVVWPG